MPRVASLYLPNLPIERIARNGRRSSSPARGGGPPPKAVVEGALHAHSGSPDPTVRPGEEFDSSCSCPRGGGWRPGARWARREQVRQEIDALPLHQRPPVRELGRRSEAADVPFRSSPARGGGPPPKAVVEGAFRAPLVTSHRVGSRILVAAASPAAQALGLSAGMPLTQARALVPGLEVRDADPAADAALLGRLADFAARRWTPRVAVSDPAGLWLDLSGTAHLFGGERAMCARILDFCARLGFSARIAVAGTPGAAHALARFGAGPVTLCPPGGEAEALAPLPLAALRLEESALSAARRLGLERICELMAMPRAPLGRRFGKALLDRLDQALGRLREPIEPVVPADAPEAALRFAEPIATAESIAAALGLLMPRLAANLGRAGLAARAVLLVCRRIDKAEQNIGIGTARATRDAAHLLRLMRDKIVNIEPGFGIESMRLIAIRTERLGAQPIEGALAGEPPAPDLAPLIDRLAGRLGARSLYRSSAVESDVPERSVRRVGPLAAAAQWPREWPRPVRVLTPPERVDNVVALLPDQPPRRFTWRGRAHQVRRADGPERIHGEWWRRSGEADAVRDYFQVEDEEGARFWLYRRGDGADPRTGDLSWWMQGMFG